MTKKRCALRQGITGLVWMFSLVRCCVDSCCADLVSAETAGAYFLLACSTGRRTIYKKKENRRASVLWRMFERTIDTIPRRLGREKCFWLVLTWEKGQHSRSETPASKEPKAQQLKSPPSYRCTRAQELPSHVTFQMAAALRSEEARKPLVTRTQFRENDLEYANETKYGCQKGSALHRGDWSRQPLSVSGYTPIW